MKGDTNSHNPYHCLYINHKFNYGSSKNYWAYTQLSSIMCHSFFWYILRCSFYYIFHHWLDNDWLKVTVPFYIKNQLYFHNSSVDSVTQICYDTKPWLVIRTSELADTFSIHAESDWCVAACFSAGAGSGSILAWRNQCRLSSSVCCKARMR